MQKLTWSKRVHGFARVYSLGSAADGSIYATATAMASLYAVMEEPVGSSDQSISSARTVGPDR